MNVDKNEGSQEYTELEADYQATKAREQANAERLEAAGLKPLKQGEV